MQNQPLMPPPGMGLRQVMSPNMHNLCPAQLRASFRLIDQSINLHRGEEEVAARRVAFEAQMVVEASAREEALTRELQEIHFAQALSLQAQQEMQYWENQQRETFATRLRIAEHQMWQEVSQRNHAVEVAALQHNQRLRIELEEAETSYRQGIHQEAEAFAQRLRQEVEYHSTSSAQAQSLLSAERQQYDKDLKEQAERWQQSLDMVTQGAEEELREEQEDCQELRQELAEAQTTLLEWDEWYDTEYLPLLEQQEEEHSLAETNALFRSFNPGNAEEEATQGAMAAKPLPQSSPLTPAVLQQSSLNSSHLPPSSLPFQKRAPRVSLATRGQEQEDAAAQQQLQQEAAMANQEWEAHRDQELRDALQKLQMYEEQQQATAVGTAPTLPTTQAYPSGLSGHTTGLTIGQPQVTLPNPAHRGPWATTRERYQQQVPLPTTPCMAGVSVGVPSVAAPSGVASTHGAAFPAMAVPNPTTPLGAFPTQTPLPAGQPTTGDEYFKREKSPLPKLVIKSGDATTITRVVHEWLQKTAMALNTWSSSAIQLWHHAVGVAKSAHAQWTLMVPSQRALQTGLPSTGNSLPPQLSVLEATMRADLINQCLPERVQSLAIQKSATTVADLLYITFQTFLPSEPSARVDGLADIEAPVRPSRTFAEALSFLRSWRQKIMTVVNDLGGNPEPLKLFGSLRNLISSLVAGDAAFAAEINSIYKQTNVKVICSDESFLKTMDMIEIELSSRSHEDEEEKRKQKNANVAIASFTQSQKGSGKSKPICRDFMTDTGCNKGGQCTFQHPQTVGRCLRCGSTKHSVADCRRPRKDSAQPASSSTNKKGKGRGKGPPLPKPKEGAKGGQKGGRGSGASSSNTPAQGKAQARQPSNKRSQQQPKAKPKPKAAAQSAEAGMAVYEWAIDEVYDPSSQEPLQEVPFAGCLSIDDFAHACSFYTTYNPAFHSSEPTDADGVLPPILDTGATHCLLPLTWLTYEQAASAKKIHLRVASGTSVRALLYNNLIYCKTVSRPLLSVGQLKAMLDLRFLWDDSAPSLLTCSGGLRYVLLQASVMHHLPVVKHHDMHVLLEAIHAYTETGELWDARTWSQKLGRKLSLYHWGAPITSLPDSHADFTQDPQVNFSAAQEPLPSPFTTSTVVIQDLDDPMTNHVPMLDAKGKDASTSIGLVQNKTLPDSATPGCYFQDNSANSSKKVSFKSSSLLSPASEQEGKTDSTHDSVSLHETLPDLHTTSYSTKDFADSEQPAASSNRSSSLLSPGPSQAFAMTTMTHPLDTTTLDDVHDEMLALMQHSLPKSRTRTNVVTTQYTPRGRLFGAYTTRGMGSTHATWRFPKVVQAIVKIAATRPSGFDSAPFLSAQLNAASSLPIHKDKNNDGRSWLIAFGDYEGGRLWLESPVGTEPPPEAAADWQKKLRGEYHSVKNRWLCFDPSLYHCVERVRSGDRRSLALFSPKNWRKLSPQCIDELDEVGFCPPTLAQVAEAEATALPSVGVALSLPSLAELDAAQGPLPEAVPYPSSTTTTQALTMTIPDDDEMKEIEEWCRDDSVALPFAELPASNGAFLPLTQPEKEELAEHLRTGHLNKTNLCRGCLEAEGPRKIHRTVRDIDKATHTLHIDIAGPLAVSDDGFAYFLVGALRMPGLPLLIDVRTLTSRTSTEVCDELEKMVSFLEALQTEGFGIGETSRIKRLHSDRAGEFTAPYFSRFLANHKSMHHSFTSGYDPQANGTAERAVGLIKSLASRCLCTAGSGPFLLVLCCPLRCSIPPLPCSADATKVFAIWCQCSCTSPRSSRR